MSTYTVESRYINDNSTNMQNLDVSAVDDDDDDDIDITPFPWQQQQEQTAMFGGGPGLKNQQPQPQQQQQQHPNFIAMQLQQMQAIMLPSNAQLGGGGNPNFPPSVRNNSYLQQQGGNMQQQQQVHHHQQERASLPGSRGLTTSAGGSGVSFGQQQWQPQKQSSSSLPLSQAPQLVHSNQITDMEQNQLDSHQSANMNRSTSNVNTNLQQQQQQQQQQHHQNHLLQFLQDGGTSLPQFLQQQQQQQDPKAASQHQRFPQGGGTTHGGGDPLTQMLNMQQQQQDPKAASQHPRNPLGGMPHGGGDLLAQMLNVQQQQKQIAAFKQVQQLQLMQQQQQQQQQLQKTNSYNQSNRLGKQQEQAQTHPSTSFQQQQQQFSRRASTESPACHSSASSSERSNISSHQHHRTQQDNTATMVNRKRRASPNDYSFMSDLMMQSSNSQSLQQQQQQQQQNHHHNNHNGASSYLRQHSQEESPETILAADTTKQPHMDAVTHHGDGSSMATTSEDATSLLHNTCKVFSNNLVMVEMALQMDPEAIRRPVPITFSSDDNSKNTNSTNETVRSGGGISGVCRIVGPSRSILRGNKRTALEQYSYPINIALRSNAPTEVLELLIKEGKDVLQLPDGPSLASSLGIAIGLECDSRIIQMLVKANAKSASIADRHSNTALHALVRSKRVATYRNVQLVLHAHPEALHAKNFHRESPLDLAVRSESCPEEVVNFLQSRAFRGMEATQEDHLEDLEDCWIGNNPPED